MKELEVYGAVLILNDLNPLRLLHVAFEFIGKIIIASANIKFFIFCMKENSLVRVINSRVYGPKKPASTITFFLSSLSFPIS
jgi:hypothetical protein